MGYFFMASTSSKTATYSARNAVRCNDFSQRACHFCNNVHPNQTPLELLLQSNRKRAFLLAPACKAVAYSFNEDFCPKRTARNSRRFYYRQKLPKGPFCRIAPRSCETFQSNSIPLGTTACVPRHHFSKRFQVCSVPSPSATHALNWQHKQINNCQIPFEASSQAYCPQYACESTHRCLVYERPSGSGVDPYGNSRHRAGSQRFSSVPTTRYSPQETKRQTSQIWRKAHFPGSATELFSSAEKFKSLWESQMFPVLLGCCTSPVLKRILMQNCLEPFSRRSWSLDQMASTHFYRQKSFCPEYHPDLCFAMVDRTNVQRTEKYFWTYQCLGTNKTSTSQMDYDSQPCLLSTSATISLARPKKRCRTFCNPMAYQSTGNRRLDGRRYHSLFLWLSGSHSLEPKVAKINTVKEVFLRSVRSNCLKYTVFQQSQNSFPRFLKAA